MSVRIRAIREKKVIWNKKEAVDLDLSVGAFDANKTLAEVVYFGNLNLQVLYILVMTEQVMWMEMMV